MTSEPTTAGDRARLLECAAMVARSMSPKPWEATLESTQFGAHADVLCRRTGAGGSVYVALNFVTDPFEPAEMRARHHALDAAGVRSAWFVVPEQSGQIFRDLPAAVFTPVTSWRTLAGDLPEWAAAGVSLSTEAAVAALLAGHFRLREYLLLSGPYYIRLDPVRRACWNCETRFVDVSPSVLRADDHGELVDPARSADPKQATREQGVIGQLIARTLACDPWKVGPVCSWRAERIRDSSVVQWKGHCPSCEAPARDRGARRVVQAADPSVSLSPVTYAIKAPPVVVAHTHWCYAPGTPHGSHCPNPPAESTDVLATHETPVLATASLHGVRRRDGLDRDLTELIAPLRTPGPRGQSLERLS